VAACGVERVLHQRTGEEDISMVDAVAEANFDSNQDGLHAYADDLKAVLRASGG
jgi:hypothetical protein